MSYIPPKELIDFDAGKMFKSVKKPTTQDYVLKIIPIITKINLCGGLKLELKKNPWSMLGK